MKRNQIRKLENQRYSILTNNLDICYICGKSKQELHEVFDGKNRTNSMKWGCVIPVCKQCHLDIHANKRTYTEFGLVGLYDYTHTIMYEKFLEVYPEVNFYSIFYKKYPKEILIQLYN